MGTESVSVSLVGGLCSGTVCTILFQPLDFIKTQLQLRPAESMTGVCKKVLSQKNRATVIRSLWVGLNPSLAKTVPGVACYFVSLSQVNRLYGGDVSGLAAVILGSVARIITAAIVQPFSLIKTRYESGRFGYRSIASAVLSVTSEDRIRGLYRGFLPTLIRDAPFSGIYLAVYTGIKKNLFSQQQDTIQATGVSGSVAGLVAATVTHPADVVKTRIQVDRGRGSGNVVRELYQREGMTVFWAGFVPRTLRRTLVSATAWVVYEEIRKAAERQNQPIYK